MISLSDDEIRSLAHVLASISARAKRNITLHELLTRWEAFVRQVQAGYSLTGYDYIDDLSVRDVLEEVMAAAPLPLHARLEKEAIGPIDDRFKAATRSLSKPLRLGSPEQPGWWWLRAPHDLTGELAADILAPE